MNESFNRPFTKEDIHSALKSMSHLKASGVDGMGVVFYQRFWYVIGREVVPFCIQILQGDFLVHSINHTHIVLILKAKSPCRMTEFRPISLCNVVYKIASKALVNRFLEVLPYCIDEA